MPLDRASAPPRLDRHAEAGTRRRGFTSSDIAPTARERCGVPMLPALPADSAWASLLCGVVSCHRGVGTQAARGADSRAVFDFYVGQYRRRHCRRWSWAIAILPSCSRRSLPTSAALGLWKPINALAGEHRREARSEPGGACWRSAPSLRLALMLMARRLAFSAHRPPSPSGSCPGRGAGEAFWRCSGVGVWPPFAGSVVRKVTGVNKTIDLLDDYASDGP